MFRLQPPLITSSDNVSRISSRFIVIPRLLTRAECSRFVCRLRIFVCSNAHATQIFIASFDHCVRMHEDLEEDQEMISPYQFGLLVADWTNPQKTAPA